MDVERASRTTQAELRRLRKIIFDLGNEVQPEEIEMIRELSHVTDVHAVVPWSGIFETYRTGRSYQKSTMVIWSERSALRRGERRASATGLERTDGDQVGHSLRAIF